MVHPVFRCGFDGVETGVFRLLFLPCFVDFAGADGAVLCAAVLVEGGESTSSSVAKFHFGAGLFVESLLPISIDLRGVRRETLGWIWDPAFSTKPLFDTVSGCRTKLNGPI